MGLAASQARLLLLTARKSDLEYRAQSITNTEMVLAMQTEAVARKYSEAISNTCLFFTKAEATGSTQIALSMANIENTTAGAYKVKYLVDKNNPQDENSWVEIDTSANGEMYRKEDGTLISAAEYETLNDDEKAKCTRVIGGAGYNFNELQLIQGINNGTLRIYGLDEDGNWTHKSMSGNTKFTESYYTDDDAAAEAEYKRETASIQVKEKRLQTELNQVEAQQKACDTEIDSVKKVMEKNIDRTFKVFS